MKYIKFIFLFSLIGIVDTFAQTNTQKLTELFKGVINFDGAHINDDRPIPNINLLAAKQADTMFILKKDNMAKVMGEAKKYQSCVISVERHTVVLVKSWSNCSKSGSWNYCMPYGIGYIQHEGLTKKEDYIKNIIGTPDFQRRTVFLFKKK
jgi:hypothetical protein